MVAGALAGCGGGGEPGGAAAGADTTDVRDDLATAEFDPGTIRPGDSIAGLRVEAVDVRRVFEDSVWAGTVRFSGELELSGVYQPHFDFPEVDALCFHLDAASAARTPRFRADAWTAPNEKPWLCFQSGERARELLGSPEAPREARIVVDDYTEHRRFTDAWDQARLVRVLERGREREPTLRGMGRFP